jgi:propanol-preferring alcohol dehydrogenase
MSDVPAFPYALLWGERVVRSVANLTRHDGERFFDLARQFALQVKPVPFALGDANEALNGLRSGLIEGAAVLVP